MFLTEESQRSLFQPGDQRVLWRSVELIRDDLPFFWARVVSPGGLFEKTCLVGMDLDVEAFLLELPMLSCLKAMELFCPPAVPGEMGWLTRSVVALYRPRSTELAMELPVVFELLDGSLVGGFPLGPVQVTMADMSLVSRLWPTSG